MQAPHTIEAEGTTHAPGYDVLDRDPDADLKRIARLAAHLFRVPTVLVTLSDAETMKVKASVGLEEASGYDGTAFCEHAVRTRSMLVVPDASQDSRFNRSPIVTGSRGIRFYAGAPIPIADGKAAGTICIMDSEARPDLLPAERDMLDDMALLVRERLEARQERARRGVAVRLVDLTGRLLNVMADALDIRAALDTAAEIVRDAANGQECALWQLNPTNQQASLVAIAGQGTFATAELHLPLRDLTLTPAESPVCRSLRTQRQVVIRSISAAAVEAGPARPLMKAGGIVAQIATPISLLGERYAFAVGFGQVTEDFDQTAQLLRDAAPALRAVLRRHKDEEAARLFHCAVEASSDPVVVTEISPGERIGDRITYVNPAFERETGYAAAEVVGSSPDILHGPGTSAVAVERIRNANLEDSPPRQEILQYNKSGTWVSVEANVTPVRDLAGRCTHLVAVHRDMTERHRVERIRMENSLELEALMSAMPGALIRLVPDANGSWSKTYIAPSIEALTGLSAADYKPGDLRARIRAADLPLLDAQVRLAFELGHSTAEIGFQHRDGRDRIFLSQMRGNTRADGTREVIMSWTDLTREHDMAAHLARTAKLAQLGELAAGMAHEMNQPLAGISLAAENAVRSLGQYRETLPRVQQKLELIVDLASRAASVIDHMRIFGRTGSGPSGPVNLGEVLASATRLLQGKLSRSGVEIVSAVPPDLPSLLGKAVPLEQVFINLLVNACDAYMDAGTTSAAPRLIWVRAFAWGDQIRITVRDLAGGIRPDVLPRVFEPFFTTKQAGQGTGLGLSISYGIVADMEGDLAASSSGAETTFTVTLPSVPWLDRGIRQRSSERSGIIKLRSDTPQRDGGDPPSAGLHGHFADGVGAASPPDPTSPRGAVRPTGVAAPPPMSGGPGALDHGPGSRLPSGGRGGAQT